MTWSHFTPEVPKNRIIGHRGVAALAPENTMASFRLAKKLGIDWIEFDIQLTKDNGLVIFHDDTLERTTKSHGYIYNKTLNELKTLDAGSWFDIAFQGEKIPLFNEALSEMLLLQLHLNIELKLPEAPSLPHVENFARSYIDSHLSHWPKDHPLPLVSSFHWPILHKVRASIPNLPLGFLVDYPSFDIIDMVSEISNASLNCNFLNLTDDLVAYALKKSVPLLVYTINDPTVAISLLKAGVFAIFSDDPTKITPS